MDKIDSLIKVLNEFKEELNKNVNMSYSGEPNVSKADMNKRPDVVRPDAGYGKVTVKDTGPAMPADPKKPGAYGKVIIKADEDALKAEELAMGKGCGMGSMSMAKNGQWQLNKAIPGISSKHIFSMDHIKSVADSKDHDSAKKLAHSAIQSSNARDENKHKARHMVEQSKNVNHLAQGMTNFHMAHDAKIRGRLGGKKDHE